MNNRKASAQYDHWVGSSAFDDVEANELTNFARNAEYIKSNERILSFEARYINVTKQIVVTINYTSLPFNEVNYTDLLLSQTSFGLSPDEFFRMFKLVYLSGVRINE